MKPADQDSHFFIHMSTTRLTPSLLVSSADHFCKQFGPRPGPKEHQTWSCSKLFDILIVFLKEIFQKVDFEKNSADDKRAGKISQGAKS